MFIKGKGKQSREDSQTKIQDEIIAPYVIYFDGTTFTVVKEKNDGKEENIGYFTKLSNSLVSISKLLSNNSNTLDLKNYIEQYNNISTKITNTIKI
jgi:hypothetical protein